MHTASNKQKKKKKYKDALVGVAEELCDRTSRKFKEVHREAETKDGDGRGGGMREAWKMIECIKDRGEQPPISLRHMYGPKKKAATRAVDRARRSREEELYRKLDDDGGKKMIFKMARDRTKDGREVTSEYLFPEAQSRQL